MRTQNHPSLLPEIERVGFRYAATQLPLLHHACFYMSSLLAIFLVANSTGGHQFVLSYPPDPQRPTADKDSLEYPVVRPKNESNTSDNHRLPPNASDAQVRKANSSDTGNTPAEYDAFAGRDFIFNMEVSFLADALAPEHPLCNQKFQLTLDDLTFVGHPVTLSQGDSKKPQIKDELSPDKERQGSHMTLFHVVFVMSPPDLELNAQTDAMYMHVVRRYASALQYEQQRCGYVFAEVENILAIKDAGAAKGTPYDQVMKNILQESSLARDIKEIYTAISSDKIAHVIINDFIDLSLQFPRNSHLTQTDQASASLVDMYSRDGNEFDHYPVICPYHALLLLEDAEEVLKNMPLDASPTLVQLVQILTPRHSLQELHLLLDCSLAQIYRLAAHLVYWRKAKLIHAIHARNVYVVSPEAKLEDLNALNADFKLHTPHLELPILLSQLSVAKPLHLIAPKELRDQYLEAITYLVRKDIVIQLHMFLVLLRPVQHRPSFTSLEEEVSSAPSPNERERSLKITEKAPKEIADLFERLTIYMDGKHPIEEIMYREGVSRRQLGLVLKYYRDSIVTVYHY